MWCLGRAIPLPWAVSIGTWVEWVQASTSTPASVSYLPLPKTLLLPKSKLVFQIWNSAFTTKQNQLYRVMFYQIWTWSKVNSDFCNFEANERYICFVSNRKTDRSLFTLNCSKLNNFLMKTTMSKVNQSCQNFLICFVSNEMIVEEIPVFSICVTL